MLSSVSAHPQTGSKNDSKKKKKPNRNPKANTKIASSHTGGELCFVSVKLGKVSPRHLPRLAQLPEALSPAGAFSSASKGFGWDLDSSFGEWRLLVRDAWHERGLITALLVKKMFSRY